MVASEIANRGVMLLNEGREHIGSCNWGGYGQSSRRN